MKKISRRKFLFDSGVILAMVQTAGLLEGCEPTNIEKENFSNGLDLLSENGQNLVLYFLNLEFSGGNLVPKDSNAGESYIIVQLPPQSLHEAYYRQKTAADPPAPTEQQEANLSSFAFLSLQLWPDKSIKHKKIKFSPETLLDWNNANVFKVMSTGDVIGDFQIFSKPEEVNKALFAEPNAGDIITLKNYEDIVRKLVTKADLGGTQKYEPFLSLIELPQGLLLGLHTTKGDNTQISLVENKYELSLQEKFYVVSNPNIWRSVRERWNLQIKYTKNDPANPVAITSVPPALRALAICSTNSINPSSRVGDCKTVDIDNQKENKFLPAFLDEVELVYLNQMTNVSSNFNITINKGVPFLLTTSGASVQFTYHNYNIPQSAAYNSISLVGYEHHFQDGRDNYIKVSRIGCIAPTGQRALHVNIAERTILGGESFMLYYEYIEIIEPEKSYVVEPSITTATSGYATYAAFKHNDININFGGVKAGFVTTPHMNSEANSGTYFWVYNEFSTSDLMLLPFNYIDRNGNVIGKASDHAIMFMRRDFFCNASDVAAVLGDAHGRNALMLDSDDGQRLRIPFNNQVVAFTPDDPKAKNDDGTANKINQMETEFIDYVFSIAKPPANGKNIFDTATYPIFPQLSRAKVYVDHIQQYSAQKLASLIEYHADYLQYQYDAFENKAKLIVQHTVDFMAGNITKIDKATNQLAQDYKLLNKTYEKIADLFNAAGDKTGAMINTSIQVQRFALAKQAMTLPNNVNSQWKAIGDKLQTFDIFNGTSPQILNGIDLKMILSDVLGIDATPLFNLNKVTGAIGDIESYINQLGNNKVVKSVLDDVRSINSKVTEFLKAVNAAQTEFNQDKEVLLQAQSDLVASIPDVNKLKNYVQVYFQQKQLEIFSVANTALTDIQKYIRQQAITSINNVNLRANYIKDLFTATDFGLLVGKIITTINARSRDAALKAQLTKTQAFITSAAISGAHGYYNKLMATSLDLLYSDNTWLPVDLAITDYYGTNGLFDLQDQLVQITADYISLQGNIRATTAQIQAASDQVKACQAQIAQIQIKVNNSTYNNIKAFLACYDVLLAYAPDKVKELQNLHLFFTQFIKSNVGYYADAYRQYKKDVNDIRITIQNFGTLLANAENFVNKVCLNRTALIDAYITALFEQPLQVPANVKQAWDAVATNDASLVNSLNTLLTSDDGKKILQSIGAQSLVDSVTTAQENYDNTQKKVNDAIKTYENELQLQAQRLVQQLTASFNKVIAGLDAAEVQGATAAFQKAIQILTTPIEQSANYIWQTTNFKAADFGIVKFLPNENNPVTTLNINVTGKISFDPLQFPRVAAKIETYAENSLTNFGVNFLSVITIDFASISFVTGSNTAKSFSVKIRDVKFDGALSFIQALEDLLANLGDGFGLAIQPNGVSLSYNSPSFGFSAPAFTFDNISIGVKLNLYFDQSPLMLFISLSTPENKATIAVGVMGGCFYCSVGIDPKRGMRSIEMALEMGAFLGISLGPIKGSVRFMVGLYFKKDDNSVIMEGYFIAEGILSVWILSVSARLYMYVRSDNSYVTGGCTASYSVKLGFISKSFSGSYSKTIAGTQSNSTSAQKAQAMLIQRAALDTTADDLDDIIYNIFEQDNQRSMNVFEWRQLYNQFYK